MNYISVIDYIRKEMLSLSAICTHAAVFRRFLILIFIVLNSGSTYANTFCKLFYAGKNIDAQEALRSCRDGFCNKNVLHVARSLIEAGIHPDEIKMIIISPNSMGDPLSLWNIETKKVDRWAFHTLLQVGNSFVDMSSDASLRPIEMGMYVRQMLSRKNVDFRFIDIIAIPYEHYEQTDKEWGVLDHYHNRYSVQRERVPLSDYLRQYSVDYREIQKEKVSRGIVSESVEASVALANVQFLSYYSIGDQVSVRHYIPPLKNQFKISEGTLLARHSNSIELLLPDGKTQEILHSLMDPTYILELDLATRKNSGSTKPMGNFHRFVEWIRKGIRPHQQ